jgi:hypothetical protein
MCNAAGRTCADGACGGCLPDHVESNGVCIPAGAATCDGPMSIGATCDQQHRGCVDAPTGATCGDCVDGFEDLGGICAESGVAHSCELGADGSIVADCTRAHRTCVDMPQVMCGPCVAGFEDQGGTCVQSAPMCDPQACAALGRSCMGAVGAGCGDCLGGAMPADPNDSHSRCVVDQGCVPGDGPGGCPDGLVCMADGDTGQRVCRPRPCPDGQAERHDVVNGLIVSQRCVPCEIAGCGAAGETGAVWPYTIDNSDECICETLPGSYYDDGANRALPCDADDDGWIRLQALSAVESSSPALRENARCEPRTIDRFVLQNEYGQREEILTCNEGSHPAEDGPCQTGERRITLAESSDLDDPDSLGRPAIASGGQGRTLQSRELNPLTKVCAAGADANLDRLDDVGEHQASAPGPDLQPELRDFIGFAYFLELHDGFYEPPPFTQRQCAGPMDCASNEHCAGNGLCQRNLGAYVIREKSRCDADFPFRYAQGEGDYWRNCTRNRDASWDAIGLARNQWAPIGDDFAQWQCDAQQGTCPVPPPPTLDVAIDEVPLHGLCDQADQPPTLPPGAPWRGMTHHSQFKCVQVAAANQALDPARQPQLVHADAFSTGNGEALQIEQCHVACPDADPTCAADCAHGNCATSAHPTDPDAAVTPASPVVACDPVSYTPQGAPVGAVTWVAVRYVGSANGYQRGCIDEWEPGGPAGDAITAWKGLCPGYLDNPHGAAGDALRTDFGRLVCGCNVAYGGPACDLGCPESMIGGEGMGPDCEDGYCPRGTEDHPGRLGYWMCAGVSRTSLEPDPDDGYVLSDGEPGGFRLTGDVTNVDHVEACEPDPNDPNGCAANGWRLR